MVSKKNKYIYIYEFLVQCSPTKKKKIIKENVLSICFSYKFNDLKIMFHLSLFITQTFENVL